MSFSFNDQAYKINLSKRETRVKKAQKADTELKDIRLYFTYDVPNTFFYLYQFAVTLARILQQKKFLCPGYHHIYISVGENRQIAISRASEVEDWYRFGIAVLPEFKLLGCPEEKLEELMLNTIVEGLMDIATLDHLDKVKIQESVYLAKEWGIFHERIINEKENRKFCFRISARPLKGRIEEEIFFSLIDREAQIIYKWKFGELHALEASCWFFKLHVTNKVVKTKPRANMELVLKGRKNKLEMAVEEIKNGERIVLADTEIPVEPWITELENKLVDGSTQA